MMSVSAARPKREPGCSISRTRERSSAEARGSPLSISLSTSRCDSSSCSRPTGSTSFTTSQHLATASATEDSAVERRRQGDASKVMPPSIPPSARTAAQASDRGSSAPCPALLVSAALSGAVALSIVYALSLDRELWCVSHEHLDAAVHPDGGVALLQKDTYWYS